MAAALQIKSFTACTDPFKGPQTHETRERLKGEMTDMRTRVALEESHPNTCSSNHVIVQAVRCSLCIAVYHKNRVASFGAAALLPSVPTLSKPYLSLSFAAQKVAFEFFKERSAIELQQKPRIADYWALMRSTPSLPSSRKHLMLFLFGPEN